MTEEHQDWNCQVGSNGKDDNDPSTRWFVVTANHEAGLMEYEPIERHQITEVLYEINECTGAPAYRRDRYCRVVLTAKQVDSLGWEVEYDE